MELLQLKYFCEAAKNENFSKTAKNFMVPTSNISQTISRLEKELGKKLFVRSANKISLNENGKIFYDCIKPALENIEKGKKALENDNSLIKSKIKIQICANRRIVTEAIEEFRNLYPGVTFYLSHSTDAVEDFDFIINDELADEKNYNKTLLVDEDIFLAVSNDNPVSKIDNLSALDLKNERFITMTGSSSLSRIAHKICSTAGFEPDIIIQSDDPFYIRKYVEMGMGIALFPAFSWQGQFAENVVLKKLNGFKRKTYIFTKKEQFYNFSKSRFLDLLIKTCEKDM